MQPLIYYSTYDLTRKNCGIRQKNNFNTEAITKTNMTSDGWIEIVTMYYIYMDLREGFIKMRFPVTTGIILAGGAGHRLGYPKSLQKINEQSMIERVAIRISSVSDTLLIITNREQFNAISNLGLKAKIVVDCSPGQGPLIGIYTGLSISNTFYNLIVGCDMPTLNIYLLRHFIKSAPGYDAVVPVLKNKTEPLHSIYSKNCIAHIKQLIDQGIRSVSPLFSMVNTRYICEDEIDAFDPHYLSFFNVNTRRDKIKAEAIIKQLDRGA